MLVGDSVLLSTLRQDALYFVIHTGQYLDIPSFVDLLCAAYSQSVVLAFRVATPVNAADRCPVRFVANLVLSSAHML